MVTIAGTMRTVSRTGIGIAGVFIIKMYKKLHRVAHSEHVLTGTTIAVEGKYLFWRISIGSLALPSLLQQ